MQPYSKMRIKSCDETQLPQVRALIEEYMQRLGRDLAFQHIREELHDISANMRLELTKDRAASK